MDTLVDSMAQVLFPSGHTAFIVSYFFIHLLWVNGHRSWSVPTDRMNKFNLTSLFWETEWRPLLLIFLQLIKLNCAMAVIQGAFHWAKISGNFGRNINGTLRSWWKFPEKVVHLQKWSSLTGRSGPTETCRSIFKNSRFQSHFTEK